MYALVDFLIWGGSVASFVYLIKVSKPEFLPIPVIGYLISPVITEGIYNLAASLFGKPQKLQPCPDFNPIVYSPEYNLTLCYVERLHPFDSEKYRHVYELLINSKMILAEDTTRPSRISRSMLLLRASPWLLFKLCYSLMVSKYVEMPLFVFPSWLLRWRVLNPMLAATEGTLMAAEIALRTKKYGINLSGGFHHANVNYGGGFCIYPDITLCVEYVRRFHRLSKVIIVDLDAHQGNGYERDLLGDQDVYILDIYNDLIYPGDTYAAKAIKKQVCVDSTVDDNTYISLLSDALEQSLRAFAAELVIYNAGTDIMKGDPLGNCRISPQAIIKRDEIVFERCRSHNVPVCMVLSGGYQRTNAEVIAESITNILYKFRFTED